MEGWEAFAAFVGGTTGVLLGLLFVAASVRLDAIRGSRELSALAMSAVILLSFGVVVALLFAIPGQSVRLLGAEVLALAVSMAAWPWLNPKLRKLTRDNGAALLAKSSENVPAEPEPAAVKGETADVLWSLVGRHRLADFKVSAEWVGPTFLTAINLMLAQVVAAALLIFDVRGGLYVLAALMVLNVLVGVWVAWWSLFGDAVGRP